MNRQTVLVGVLLLSYAGLMVKAGYDKRQEWSAEEAATIAAEEAEFSKPKEFVCYTDGELTERHVGVKWAQREDKDIWLLTYVDTDEAKAYKQEAGESCGVEVL